MRSEDLTLAVNRDMPLDMPPDHSAPDIADSPAPRSLPRRTLPHDVEGTALVAVYFMDFMGTSWTSMSKIPYLNFFW